MNDDRSDVECEGPCPLPAETTLHASGVYRRKGRRPRPPLRAVELSEELRLRVVECARARSESDQAKERARLQMAHAVEALRAGGYSTRQVAEVLGCTHQRVSQIEGGALWTGQ